MLGDGNAGMSTIPGFNQIQYNNRKFVFLALNLGVDSIVQKRIFRKLFFLFLVEF